MEVRVILMGDPLRVRKCGCIGGALSDWRHWWRYTRLRLWGRQLRGWRTYWGIRWQVWSHKHVCRVVREQCVPFMVGMGEMSPWEGLEASRSIEKREGDGRLGARNGRS